MKAKEFVSEVRKGNISVVENIEKVLDEMSRINKEYFYFNKIAENAIKDAEAIEKKIKKGDTKGKLLGLPVSVKDCICVKGLESQAGSKILNGYVPVFDATVIKKIKEEGAIVIGKTSQDAFGFGTFSVNVGIDFKVPLNPFDKERSCGGSSGGAAGFTRKTNYAHIALAESTGGSIACPASFCGVVGLTPTYGLVSRHGLIDYANSLDKIGPIAKNVGDASLMLNVIKGHDKKDSTSLNVKLPEDKKSKLRIAVVKDVTNGAEESVSKKLWEKIKQLESLGMRYEEIDLPISFKYGIPDYYIISMSEASTNLAKYCGVRYGAYDELKGNFDEYFSTVRSKYFDRESKRRIILGTFARMAGFRDAYYIKALKVRTLIIQEYKRAFKKFDILVSPTMTILPPKFSDIMEITPLQNYMLDLCTNSVNLAGLPHLSVNAGFVNGLPVGIMFTADHLQENKLTRIGELAENE